MEVNTKYQHTYKDPSDLLSYPNNPRIHSDYQIKQIADSIKEFGFTNPVLIDEQDNVIAGHGRIMAAMNLNIDKIPCIIITNLSEAQKKALVIADNQLALNSDWDYDMLSAELKSLVDFDYNIELTGFDSSFINDIIGVPNNGNDIDDNSVNYTRKIEAPIYEPKNHKPNITDLIKTEKSTELIKNIEKSDLPEVEKQFLIHAAQRHTIFNFNLIADYYAHSNMEMKKHMEESALVIIDFDKAIELGYVKMTDELLELYRDDYE